MKEHHKNAKYLLYYKGEFHTAHEFNERRAKEATKPKERDERDRVY